MNTVLIVLALMALAWPVAAESLLGRTEYQSTTATYIPYREADIADWRAANDEMAHLNGHMGHMGSRQGHNMGNDNMSPALPSAEDMGGLPHQMGDQP